MKKPKAPILDIFLLLFLTIYCRWPLFYTIYKEWILRLLNLAKLLTIEWLLIFIFLPVIFWSWIYKMNKEYFDNLYSKLFKKN